MMADVQLRMRRGQQRDPVLDNNEEIDEKFWASAAANRAAGDQALGQGMYLYHSQGMADLQMAVNQYRSKHNSSMMTETTVVISIVQPATFHSKKKMKISGQVWKGNKSVKSVLRMFISQRRPRGSM